MHEREHDHAQATPDTTLLDGDLAPGHTNRSSQLLAPANPVVSGLIRRKARDANGVAEGADQAVAAASSSSGHSLPEPIMRKFESSLGTDLSSVRVHTGGESQAAAASVGARAYTVGQDIHFGAGHYEPSSSTGQHLLAHEVAHTVQQAGSTPTRQNKLEVSSPHDAAEIEADRAADAMVSGQTASIDRGRLGIARKPADSMGDDMQREANAGGQAAAAEGPLLVAETSSLATVAQARQAMAKVIAANGNLNLRKATQEAAAKDARDYSEEQESLKKDATKTEGFVKKNDEVIGTLQHLIDLGEGNSLTGDDQRNRPGHDARLQVFAKLAQAAFVDFGRLKGVVSSFLTAHPMADEAGRKGGEALGNAVATGGKAGDAGRVAGQVQSAQRNDPILNNLVVEYKTLYESLSGDKADKNINDQLITCATVVSEAKNIKANIDLGTNRPDTPEQAAAKQEADKVNGDLAGAKAALDQAASVAKIAVSVMGMPELGVLGEGSALLPLTESKVAKGVTQVAGVESKINSGVAKVSTVDVNKAVSDSITDAIAKMLTNYDAKITAAQGHAAQANKNAGREVAKLNTDVANVAKGKITQEFHNLAKICADVEDKKFKLRSKAKEINDYQKAHKKPGQPDIGAIAQALAETTSFVKQADAAILQGDEQQKIAGEMVAEQKKMVGDWQKSNDRDQLGGTGRTLATASKADVYVDCEPAPPHLLSQHPLKFMISDNDGTGHVEAADHVESAQSEVKKQLDGLKECRETASGFESSLKKAMGF